MCTLTVDRSIPALHPFASLPYPLIFYLTPNLKESP